MRLFTIVPFLALSITPARSIETLTSETFEALHQNILPMEDAWTTIPWQVKLAPAQRLAAQSGKPLFIWAMDGHPLGCT